MIKSARGTFEVQLKPHPPYDDADGVKLARITIEKQFHGDLQGTSLVEMISTTTEVKGSAGYVAMERVNGVLQGRSGSFVLQHSGTMNRGVAELKLSVVPDSASGELKGLSGNMKIDIAEQKHFYEFEYALDEDN